MVGRELRFLGALWKANLLAAMEYRAAFISQVIGMALNNAVYFLFWVLFFGRFGQVGGWGLNDMLLLFGVVAVSWGLGATLFGNALALGDVIANGQLDYYLSLPRPVLLHVLASRSMASGLGDFTYGLLSFAVAGHWTVDAVARFAIACFVSLAIFFSFLVLVQNLAFWLGNASMLAGQLTNAIITFALYPITLFDGTAKLLLFTAIPAALVGAVPAEFVRAFSWRGLGLMVLGAAVVMGLAVWSFQRGLRRYESGSAVQVRA